MKITSITKTTPWTNNDYDNYYKMLDELLAAGLYIEEADEVIHGDMTFEEALKICKEKRDQQENLDKEIEYVKVDNAEDMKKVLDECNKIAKERFKKGLY